MVSSPARGRSESLSPFRARPPLSCCSWRQLKRARAVKRLIKLWSTSLLFSAGLRHRPEKSAGRVDRVWNTPVRCVLGMGRGGTDSGPEVHADSTRGQATVPGKWCVRQRCALSRRSSGRTRRWLSCDIPAAVLREEARAWRIGRASCQSATGI